MRKELGMAVALVALCAAIAYSNPAFYGESNVANLTRQVSMLGIFAVGVAFVIITGGIDLSIGSMIGLSGVIVARISAPVEGSGAAAPLWIGVTVAMVVALLVGLAQGLLITRLRLQPFIVTLGGMLLLRGVAQAITGGGSISFGAHPFTELGDGGVEIPLSFLGRPDEVFLLPYASLVFLGVAGLATYVLHLSVWGRYLYAIGGNREAAEYSGVPVARVETFAYMVSAGLAGLAGVLYAAYVGQLTHGVGEAYELVAIAAAVIGGCSLRGGEGSVFGVFVGATIFRVLENGINLFEIEGDGPLARALRGAGVLDPLVAIDLLRPTAGVLKLNDNWKNVIIGAVILGAVILDQVTHLWQERRRKRSSRAAAMADSQSRRGVS